MAAWAGLRGLRRIVPGVRGAPTAAVLLARVRGAWPGADAVDRLPGGSVWDSVPATPRRSAVLLDLVRQRRAGQEDGSMSHAVEPAFADDCADPRCAVCAIWQRPDESDADWRLRLRSAASATTEGRTLCYRGLHPWTTENTRMTAAGYSLCRLCQRESGRRMRERRREAAA